MSRLLAGPLFAVLLGWTSPAFSEPSSLRISQSVSVIQANGAALMKRLEAGAGDPVRDAQAAAARGDFGFINSGSDISGLGSPVGVICRTPYGQGISITAAVLFGHVVDKGLLSRRARITSYGSGYNRTLIDHPRFPIADLCAPAEGATTYGPNGLGLIGQAARRLARPPLSLHEAARRGSLAQVSAFLVNEEVDNRDHFGMTPLAWAVAYGREPIVSVLIRAGAGSMAADSADATPVMAAINHGRVTLLRRLDAPRPYPAHYVEAAIRTDDIAIVREVFSQPHEAPRLGWLHRLAPSPEVAQILIGASGQEAANAILVEAARRGDIELMKRAIARGADVNASAPHKPPLFAALELYNADPLPVAEVLIAAGADVNIQPRSGQGHGTPFWRAYQRAVYSEGRIDLLRLFARAGGDARLAMRPGKPPVWTVVFPSRGDLGEIIAPSPEIMALLVASGLDLNAVLDDKCVLDAVENVTGPGGQVAQNLRHLGARRRAASGVCEA